MKKTLSIFSILFIISCGGLSKTLHGGDIEISNYKEIIPFNYDYNFALIKVEINNKFYTFLVDTGAPTLISNEIYKDLNIKPANSTNVIDSQGQFKKQDVVIIPQIKLGNLTYNNIGAVVANLRDVFEFNCMKIDGIIGANQMAKSYWKFDYQNHEITITDKLENYDLKSYKDTLDFSISSQKTPHIKGTVNGLETTFTYDTGSSGNIDVEKKTGHFKDAIGYNAFGSSSIGLYNAKDSVNIRTIKIDDFKLGNLDVGAQVIELDHGSLIGNSFMNKYDVVIDWINNKIYLKKLKDFEKTEKSSFGFSFRLRENKAIITSLIKELPLDIQIGDQLLQINDYNLRNLDDSSSCDIFDNVKLKELETVKISYLHNDKEYSTTLSKVILIE